MERLMGIEPTFLGFEDRRFTFKLQAYIVMGIR
jgi:hypothetical protein